MSLAGTTVVQSDGTASVLLKNDDISRGYRVDALAVRVDGVQSGQIVKATIYDGINTLAPKLTESGNGALDEALGPFFMGPGKALLVVWTGGSLGQTATATITGERQDSGIKGTLSFQVQAPGDLVFPSLYSIAAATPFRIRDEFTAADNATTTETIPDFIPVGQVAWITHWSAGFQATVDLNSVVLRLLEPGTSNAANLWAYGRGGGTLNPARNYEKTVSLKSPLIIGRVEGEALPDLQIFVDRVGVGVAGEVCRWIMNGLFLNLGGPSVGN